MLIYDMKIESFIRLLAGTFVLLGVGLAQFISPCWLWLAASVGPIWIKVFFAVFAAPSLVLRQVGGLDDAGIIRWGGASGPASRIMRLGGQIPVKTDWIRLAPTKAGSSIHQG